MLNEKVMSARVESAESRQTNKPNESMKTMNSPIDPSNTSNETDKPSVPTDRVRSEKVEHKEETVATKSVDPERLSSKRGEPPSQRSGMKRAKQAADSKLRPEASPYTPEEKKEENEPSNGNRNNRLNEVRIQMPGNHQRYNRNNSQGKYSNRGSQSNRRNGSRRYPVSSKQTYFIQNPPTPSHHTPRQTSPDSLNTLEVLH